MGYLTKYGTLWGDVPETTGRIVWVAPALANSASTLGTYIDGRLIGSGNDSNDGLSPEKPLQTIDQAVTNALANAGSGYANDVIMLLPGTHYNYTLGNTSTAKTVKLNCPGLTFVGVNPGFRQNENVRNYAPATAVNMSGSGAMTSWALSVGGCSFIGINFVPVTAQTSMTGLTCPRTLFVDCTVTLSAAASTSTKGLIFSGGSSQYVGFSNCTFLNTVATSAQGPALDLTALADFFMDSCNIILSGTSSAWAVAVQLGAASSGVVNRSLVSSRDLGTITVGFDGTGVAVAGAVLFSDCRTNVLPGAAFAKNWTATNATLVENRTATVGGGSGSTLITTTT